MGIRESLHLSQDAVLGMPVITIIGCREVHIENFRTILEYSDTFVKMRTKKGVCKRQRKASYNRILQ